MRSFFKGRAVVAGVLAIGLGGMALVNGEPVWGLLGLLSGIVWIGSVAILSRAQA